MSERIVGYTEQLSDSQDPNQKDTEVAQNTDVEGEQVAWDTEQPSSLANPDLRPDYEKPDWQVLEEERGWEFITDAINALGQASDINPTIELERVKKMNLKEAWAHVINLNRTAKWHGRWVPREDEEILKRIPLDIRLSDDGGSIFGFIKY